jgi:hypothetical protein
MKLAIKIAGHILISPQKIVRQFMSGLIKQSSTQKNISILEAGLIRRSLSNSIRKN